MDYNKITRNEISLQLNNELDDMLKYTNISDDLITNSEIKVLSAKQGVALKSLIDSLSSSSDASFLKKDIDETTSGRFAIGDNNTIKGVLSIKGLEGNLNGLSLTLGNINLRIYGIGNKVFLTINGDNSKGITIDSDGRVEIIKSLTVLGPIVTQSEIFKDTHKYYHSGDFVFAINSDINEIT